MLQNLGINLKVSWSQKDFLKILVTRNNQLEILQNKIKQTQRLLILMLNQIKEDISSVSYYWIFNCMLVQEVGEIIRSI